MPLMMALLGNFLGDVIDKRLGEGELNALAVGHAAAH